MEARGVSERKSLCEGGVVTILELFACLFVGMSAFVLIRWLTRDRYVKLEDEFKLSVKHNYEYQVKDFVIGGVVCVVLFYIITKQFLTLPILLHIS